jgi:hypothetical protein
MATRVVTPVRPVDPVGPVRRVERGSIYFRHLDLWRLQSSLQAAERRRQAASEGSETGFARLLPKQGR